MCGNSAHAFVPFGHDQAMTSPPGQYLVGISGDHTVFVLEVVEAHLNNPDAKVLEMWDTGWFYGG